MKARDWVLAACLFGCQLWGISAGQQAPSAAGIGAPPEPHPAAAAAPLGPTVYNVEVIVFRTNSTLGSPENWSAETAQAQAAPLAADGETGPAANETAGTSGAGALQGASGRFVRALTPAEFQLSDLEARIKASGAYVPVAHLAWAQTASPWGNS